MGIYGPRRSDAWEERYDELWGKPKRKRRRRKMKKKKAVKEPISELFVITLFKEGMQLCGDEHAYEMLKVGVTERQLPTAMYEFAMDSLPSEFDRLNNSEQEEVRKRLKKYFKERCK
jgi:hypothetical protein